MTPTFVRPAKFCTFVVPSVTTLFTSVDAPNFGLVGFSPLGWYVDTGRLVAAHCSRF